MPNLVFLKLNHIDAKNSAHNFYIIKIQIKIASKD